VWFRDDGKVDWSAAERHLAAADPVMKQLIGIAGPCTLRPRKDVFVVLCQSIFSQQISTAGATTLFGRFREHFPRKRPTPPTVLAALTGGLDDETIRHCGISRQKRSYLIDLSEKIIDGELKLNRLGRLDDEAMILELTKVKGVGRWTAEMILMFCYGRPDVLPVDDLGALEGARRAYELPERPTKKQFREMAQPWQPWRSIATWYLWRGGKGE
jgi:DNA-3-methyladenine glycosylase II